MSSQSSQCVHMMHCVEAEQRSASPFFCASVCVVVVRCGGGGGLGCCSGRALGELQDVHLAAGHRAHYHSGTWSHQRTKERANILLKCHCQQACKRTCKHIHKKTARTHTRAHTRHLSPHKEHGSFSKTITCFETLEMRYLKIQSASIAMDLCNECGEKKKCWWCIYLISCALKNHTWWTKILEPCVWIQQKCLESSPHTPLNQSASLPLQLFIETPLLH